MFHIKTDIRQFKCESTEKVERLIRNWVIRPSDLIYNADEKTWNPIGQHPAFDDIFSGIEKEEANEPDTIVTEAPSEVAAEHEVEPGTELEAHAGAAVVNPATVNGTETTNVRPAPTATSAESAPSVIIDPADSTLAADSEEITNVTEAPEEAAEDEITDVREDPRRDTDEQDAADSPAPPQPSDEVEGLIRDSDEITMMTDKTFEMLSEERQKETSTQPPSDDEDEASKEADEQTPEQSGEEDADEEGESTGAGRHGLPEEIFVTDEIPRQDVQQAVLDELGELEEDDEPAEDAEDAEEVTEVIDRDADADDDERKSRWRIVMSDDLEDAEVDELDGQQDADGADTGSAEDSIDSKTDPSNAGEPEDVESDSEAPDANATAEDQDPEASEGRSADDDDLDEMLDEAAELVGLGEDTEPIDIDGGALEAMGEDDEDEPRERADTPVRAVAEPKEFVSEGYKLPLPVDISPSAEDIRLGLKHSRVSRRLKDATFPYPKPKKRDEVATRTFDLNPEDPADHSVLIVAAFVVGLLIIVVGAVTIFG